MLPRLSTLLALVVSALFWTEGVAVELEPIQLRSRLGEPLLAEIRVRDAPADLQELSVGLPDPVVFARVGLPRPQGAVTDMRFDVRRGQRGDAVIRVTTSRPVAEDFLTFLVEVQWREGSLVREFSIALPAADTPAASPAMVVDAPAATVPTPPALPPDPASVDVVGAAPVRMDKAVDAFSAGTATEATPIPVIASSRSSQSIATRREAPAIAVVPNTNVGTTRAMASTPTPASRPAAPGPSIPPAPDATPPHPASASAAAAATAAGSITVHRGGNLTSIARSMTGDVPLEAALIAFLLANPEAFVEGNINRLQQGSTLRVPTADMLAAIDPQQARELVALQASDWRDGADASRRQSMTSLLAEIEAGVRANPPAVTPIAVIPAHMKIVPVENAAVSSADDHAAQLDPALEQEALATRDAEIRHLRQRIADLERAHDEQRELIAMQNEALAQARRHLGGSPGAIGFARWPWLLVAALIAGLALFAWRRMRQRPQSDVTSGQHPPSVGAHRSSQHAPVPMADLKL